MTTTAREFHLAARPQGAPGPEHFRLVEAELAQPGPGQLLVRNDVLSVDPYMRGRMNDVKSYVPPFALDAPLEGGAVGTVLASGDAAVPVGASVLHMAGWRDYALIPAKHATVVDTALAPAGRYLGALGVTGLTAWGGLLIAAEFKAGDIVFVSGAAGAVGSLVGQIAKLKGAARVIGSAGGAQKARALTERFGYDAAIDYRAGDLRGQLAQAAPEGIDVYFDNVGGEHLEAALGAARRGGRVALCGAIAQYNDAEPAPGPRNLALAIGKRLTLRGFIVFDYQPRFGEFAAEMAGWLAEGSIEAAETVVHGLENTPEAFLSLFRGANTGKMLIEL
ncbi:NADP-dependent oxidoreductase [Actinocrinis puniceicyclus]|uniref:NADP-dependent oxidoreductase n=1 Tax=Actinocrinis puniceicyclus TaxID=977794 RepID=A0A8J7WUP7_9ACTN|nr:NADP-dependent oxidoreductase [Actinocrinis puniceicyclus]MBS2966302.1 NADP-dependent oxidoreductase [Actinocrinis puniceicyclus]